MPEPSANAREASPASGEGGPAPGQGQPARYRKRPVEITALRWTGGDTDALDRFVGQNWTRADARDVVWEHDDPEQVVIYNSVERNWIPCPTGWWVICGLNGEFYPCEDDIFRRSYEPVAAAE